MCVQCQRERRSGAIGCVVAEVYGGQCVFGHGHGIGGGTSVDVCHGYGIGPGRSRGECLRGGSVVPKVGCAGILCVQCQRERRSGAIGCIVAEVHGGGRIFGDGHGVGAGTSAGVCHGHGIGSCCGHIQGLCGGPVIPEVSGARVLCVQCQRKRRSGAIGCVVAEVHYRQCIFGNRYGIGGGTSVGGYGHGISAGRSRGECLCGGSVIPQIGCAGILRVQRAGERRSGTVGGIAAEVHQGARLYGHGHGLAACAGTAAVFGLYIIGIAAGGQAGGCCEVTAAHGAGGRGGSGHLASAGHCGPVGISRGVCGARSRDGHRSAGAYGRRHGAVGYAGRVGDHDVGAVVGAVGGRVVVHDPHAVAGSGRRSGRYRSRDGRSARADGRRRGKTARSVRQLGGKGAGKGTRGRIGDIDVVGRSVTQRAERRRRGGDGRGRRNGGLAVRVVGAGGRLVVAVGAAIFVYPEIIRGGSGESGYGHRAGAGSVVYHLLAAARIHGIGRGVGTVRRGGEGIGGIHDHHAARAVAVGPVYVQRVGSHGGESDGGCLCGGRGTGEGGCRSVQCHHAEAVRTAGIGGAVWQQAESDGGGGLEIREIPVIRITGRGTVSAARSRGGGLVYPGSRSYFIGPYLVLRPGRAGAQARHAYLRQVELVAGRGGYRKFPVFVGRFGRGRGGQRAVAGCLEPGSAAGGGSADAVP